MIRGASSSSSSTLPSSSSSSSDDDEDANETTENNNNKEEGLGILFAFYHYSLLPSASWVQRLVRVLSASDIIHVAMTPVRYDKHAVYALPVTYTAYMGAGFMEQHTNVVMNEAYELILMPIPSPRDMRRGLRFLRRFRGSHYNYRSLILTMLPWMLKRSIPHMPTWFTQEAPTHSSEDTGGHSIFCSQMGLMLCYICNALPYHIMDPGACTPGELAHILERSGITRPYRQEQIRVLPLGAPLLGLPRPRAASAFWAAEIPPCTYGCRLPPHHSPCLRRAAAYYYYDGGHDGHPPPNHEEEALEETPPPPPRRRRRKIEGADPPAADASFGSWSR